MSNQVELQPTSFEIAPVLVALCKSPKSSILIILNPKHFNPQIICFEDQVAPHKHKIQSDSGSLLGGEN